MKKAIYFVGGLFFGLISGYLYGFKAYNRPVKWWEFWLNNRTKFFDWLVGAKFE